jgi:Protein of unknown function (DUF3147)
VQDIVLRFMLGGIVVTAFAAIGDVLKPKSFAGLFGAAPSVALATLGLTLHAKGSAYCAVEARSMMAGAVAFFVYASFVSVLMMRRRSPALLGTILAMPLWGMIAAGIWFLGLRS